MLRLRTSSIALALAMTAASCGDSQPQPQPQAKPAAADDGKSDDVPPPTRTPDAETGAKAAEDGAGSDDSWETDNAADEGFGETEDTGEAADAGAAAEGAEGAEGAEAGADAGGTVAPPHPGPCQIVWNSGTRVDFDYEDDKSGTIKIDADGNKKYDVCGSFTVVDGKPTKISVDDGCDKSVELEIEPTYVEGKNLASAKIHDKSAGTTKDMMMVALPAFTGVMPGYPLQADSKGVKTTVRTGLIRTATVKAPFEGPPRKTSFFYDKANRIATVSEDFEADGSVDQRYDYRYDASGNITRITLTLGTGEDAKKTIGKVGYKCWE